MNAGQATALLADLFRTALIVTGPVLFVSLVAGVLVGIFQTATQINEASLSFVVKVVAVGAVLVAVGSQLATVVLDYTRSSLEAITQVVR